MRTAAKNILYVVANSRAYDPANLNEGMASWKKLMYGIDAVLAVLGVALMAKFISNYKKRTAGQK